MTEFHEHTNPINAEERCEENHLRMVATRAAETIPEFEAALQHGTMDVLLQRSDLKEKLNESIVVSYQAIAASNTKHDSAFRQSWTAIFVQAFQGLLREPTKCFPAKAAGRRGQFRTLLVSNHQGDVTIRDDQAISARRWGIWFDFEDQILARSYSERLVGYALRKLESNICNLRFLEATYLAGHSKLSNIARFDPEGIGVRFEHLMCDVLNELEYHARPAPIAEDVLEKTDLRVTYPFLSRKHGARVQVSLAADARQHRKKIGAMYLPGEFICLTPMDLALCALSPPPVPLFENFEWEEFWASIGGKCVDENELARVFHNLFVDALSYPRLHPFGPMWILPRPLRLFIRAFTEYCAADTTNQVRTREHNGGKWRGSVRKFTTGRWKTELTDSSPNA